MVDKINQSMLSLAENNKEFKTALRFMLKCEIQMLLDRLADLGDESLLVVASKSEESTSHFGSACAESYLQTCAANLNFSVKDTFLQHCLKASGAGFQNQGQGQVHSMGSGNITVPAQGQLMNSNVNPMTGQGQMMNTAVNPLTGQMMNVDSMQGNMGGMIMKAAQMLQMGHQTGMMNRQMMGNNAGMNTRNQHLQRTTRFSPYQQQSGSTQKAKTDADLTINRAICRHYAKGSCWQGNMCGFLHVHPDSIEAKDKKAEKTAVEAASSTQDTAKSTAFSSTPTR